MFDSINFIAHDIPDINIARLVSLGIRYYKLRYEIGTNGKAYFNYGNEKSEIDPRFKSPGIGFKYHDINFMYLQHFNCVIIVANAHKVLDKTDILLSDRDRYIHNVMYVVETVLDIDFSELAIHRFDPCVDIPMEYGVMYEYLHLLEKHKLVYDHIKRINDYDSSIYLTSKYGEKRLNIYDKHKCEFDKYMKAYQKEFKRNGISLTDYKLKHPIDFDQYENIFRIEVQNTKVLIKNESNELQVQDKNKLDTISAHKMNKSIYGYWNIESMKKYYFEFIKGYLYTGKYYKPSKAKELIDKSDYKKSDKEHLKHFIAVVHKYGITGATKSQDKDIHPKWCGATVNTYTMKLQALDIHLWQIELDKNYDLTSALKRIDKSIYGDNWKNKLKQFLKAVKKYGVAEITSSNVDEITNGVDFSKHKRWSYATVEKYIEKLNDIGINPVTLDDNSHYNELESLYTLAVETAKEKYFDIDELNIPKPAEKQPPKPKHTPFKPVTPIKELEQNQSKIGVRRRELGR